MPRSQKINRHQLAWIARKLTGFKENGRWYFQSPHLRGQFAKSATKNGFVVELHGIAALSIVA